MNYIELNNQVVHSNEDGTLKLDKDKEAAKAYFIDYVNQNTVFFHNTLEKVKYLIDNDYYESELFEQYSVDEIERVYNTAYDAKFRFPSYISAYRFYNGYALKTNDGKKILERYEDRIAVNALFFGEGDVKKALKFVKVLINQEFQPATPTFLNVGRKRRGELVSCFLLEVGDSLNDINMAESTAKQLSKIGGGVALNLTNTRAKGESLMGYEGVTSGVVPIMRSLDQSFRHINQAGQRDGAGVVYLSALHADINDFLDTKKISADEDFRVKTLSIGVVIPDIMIQLARENKMMYTFYPHTVFKEYGIGLGDMDLTAMYEQLSKNPNIRKDKVNPRMLLEKISALRFESGYPYIMFSDNVNKVHTLKYMGDVKFSNLCVTGDTELLTDEGYKTAKELYDQGNNLNVVIDQRTKDYNLENKGSEVVSALPMALTKKDALVYRLETRQGFDIRATEWHKFYVKRDEGIVKIPLNEVRKGDRVLVQSGEGVYGENNDKDLAYLMGIIAGDGSFTESSVILYLYNDKKVLKDKVENLVENIINTHKDSLRSYQHNASYQPKFVESKSQDCLILRSTILHDILQSYGFVRNNRTRVPQFIKCADRETQASYLSGYFQMDACVNANFASKALTIELVSTDYKGVQDLQKLILNMGIYSTIYSRKRGFENLPDGKGGLKEYNVQDTHRLTIQDRESRERFMDLVQLKDADKLKFKLLTEKLQSKSRKPKHDHTAEVVAIRLEGVEDVYDTTQPDHNSLIFNGIVTGNCSEILQVSKTSSYKDYGEEDEIGLDISCNLASLNIKNVMDNKNIEGAVKLGMDALTKVSESSNIKNAPGVARANELMRSVGLGAMNLHGYLAQNGIAYESETAREFADVFFAAMNYYSIKRSNEIAIERDSVFSGLSDSTYYDGSYFKQYITEDFLPKSDKIKELFEGMKLPTKKDWEDLKFNVMRYGLYHSYRLAIAPTGSISYIQSATASVMPIMERVEERTYGNSKAYYPMPGLSPQTWFLYKEAYDMDMFKVVDMIATIQKHIDQGISFTLFMKDTDTTRGLTKIDLYAHHKGVKTLYYARTKDTGQEECLSCTI